MAEPVPAPGEPTSNVRTDGMNLSGLLGTPNTRVAPTAQNALIAAGGAAAAFGLAQIGGDSRGAIIALSLLAVALGFALLVVKPLQSLAPAGVAFIVVGLVWFARFATRDPSDFTEPGVGGALALLMLAGLILYVVPFTKGKTIFLGMALLSLWALLMSTYVDFFGAGTLSLGLSDLNGAEKGAYLSMIIGAVYLGIMWFFDQNKAKGAGLAIAFAAAIAYGVGVWGTLRADNAGRAIIAILVGVAFAIVGQMSSRRGITWLGAVGVAVGLLELVSSFFDDPGTGAGFVLLLFGLMTMAAAGAKNLINDGAVAQLKATAAAASAAGAAKMAAADADGHAAPPGPPPAPAPAQPVAVPPPAPVQQPLDETSSAEQAASSATDAAGGQPEGWYTDPSGNFELRWFDGNDWTEHVSTAGEQSEDPPS